jgi:hypothetical protein
MADPLSFFAGEDSSDSESEGDPEPENPSEKVEEDDSRPDKLPSPDTLFATVGRPSFLSTSLNPSGRRGEVNWDRFVRNDTEENVHSDGTHAAIAPPSDLENSRGNISSSLSIAIASTYTTPSHEISSAPVKYANPRTDINDGENVGVSDSAAVANRGGDGLQSSVSTAVAGTKRGVSVEEGEGEGDGGDESAKKKSKTETFRRKEKRKRDVGQSSRGKSYVEEEKRILRQAFATDEVMS